MIKFTVRFWPADKVVINGEDFRACMDSGTISIDPESGKQKDPIHFKMFKDINDVIQEHLKVNEIMLVSDHKKSRAFEKRRDTKKAKKFKKSEQQAK